eukprot:2368072-Rhodomonas_salina.6
MGSHRRDCLTPQSRRIRLAPREMSFKADNTSCRPRKKLLCLPPAASGLHGRACTHAPVTGRPRPPTSAHHAGWFHLRKVLAPKRPNTRVRKNKVTENSTAEGFLALTGSNFCR